MNRTLLTLAASLALFAQATVAQARETTTTTRSTSGSTTTTTRSVDLKPIGSVEVDGDGYIGLKPIGWIYTNSDGSVSLKPIGSDPVATLDFEWIVDPADAFVGTELAEDFISLKPIGIIEDNGTGVVGLKPIGLVQDGVSLKPIGLDTLGTDSITLKPIGYEDAGSLVGLKPIGYVALDSDGYLLQSTAGTTAVATDSTVTLSAATATTATRSR